MQDLLFQAVLADPATGQAAIEALENYLGGGALPDQEELRATLEKLVIDKLLEPLTAGEHTLLRASTLFQLPVPLTVWNKYAAIANLGSPDRLLAFGLWERLPDIADPRADAAGPNAIAAARLSALPEEETKRAIGMVLPDLFAVWGGPDRAGKPASTDIELTRLALACGNLDVLAATARFAIRGLEQAFVYREAAAVAVDTLAALESGGRVPELQLLRAAAEIFDQIGDPDGLRRVYADAANLVPDDPAQPNEVRTARAQLRGRYGGYLRRQGGPDAALVVLHAASAVFEALGDRRSRAVTLGDIAGLVRDKGEVEAALALYQEQRDIFEALGDRRARAVTLGDIARIMTAKGEVEAALALHQERRKVVRALGDQSETAAASYDIGRMQLSRAVEQSDAEAFRAAIETLAESYGIFLRIGRLDGICLVGLTLGRALAMAGERDEARAILHRSLDGFIKLGRAQQAAQVEELLRQLGDDAQPPGIVASSA